MKANEAPEKIYLQENTTTDCYDEWWPEWFEARAKNADIEYTRTDAFIEKVCEFLLDEIYDKIEDRYIRNELMEDSYASKITEDFKNYMKGE